MRTSMMFGGALVCIALACGGGGPTAAEAAKQATERDAKAKKAKAEAEAKAAEAAKKKKADDSGAPTHPWTFESVRDNMTLGKVAIYKLTGVDAKGKKVEDEVRCVVKKSDQNEVGTSCDRKQEAKAITAGQTASKDWSQDSPFFAVDRPERKVKGREKVTVPAGEFDCVVGDLKGFFGADYEVWMVADKPGIYAKVLDHGNSREEGDKTELVYELQELTEAK